MFDRLTTPVVHLLLALAALIIFALGFLVVADVVGRGVFNSPVKGTPELVSMSIVIVCFLLAAHAVQSGGMLKADVLVGAFGARGQAFSELVSGVLGVLFFGLIVWGGFGPALNAFVVGEYEGEGALRVPAWPARFVVVIGSALVVLIYLAKLVRAFRALLSKTPTTP
ncbi:TRAP transporter small permease [Rhodoplanes sp. TEM]|uniref:TRAP transporter small permease protein n=1 Tax=Rhodoplanes tepidamans TaxID=200616 RepID=A0ABT5J860_RHOTP|nr:MULTISPECIES: TRAP transporter small permease [Rhodoplanes]MDC7785688.1 TRAP transporter small permease [Rhodoplanes tepidamans]MDC7983329.1 TRAP transporter small permease [Rhodoplanes sp. TEM]MDQ0354744.1 TRAP-type C4-dicarboxylate transport system permease small subunit [Rhodoplanes tepidamans]